MVIKATQEVNVELSDEQQKIVALEYIFKHADWKSNYYVKDGWVYENETCHTTHSFDLQKKIRKANGEDSLIDEILKKHTFNL